MDSQSNSKGSEQENARMKKQIHLGWKIRQENQIILETMMYFKNLIARELPQHVKSGM